MKGAILCSLVLAAVLSFQSPAQELSIGQAVLQTGLHPVKPAYVWGGPAGGYLLVRNDDLLSVQARSGKETVLLTGSDLVKMLAGAGLKPVATLPLPTVLPDGSLRFQYGNAFADYSFSLNRIAGSLACPEPAENFCPAPSATLAAYTLGQNIYLTIPGTGTKTVTRDREAGIVNGQTVSRSEFGISSGLFWSSNSSSLAFFQKDERRVTEYPLVNISATPATAEMIRYPMAGGPGEIIRVGIYRIADSTTVFLDEQAFGDDRYMTNVTWDPSGASLYVAVLNREQNHMMLNQYDAATGKKIRTLFEETSPKYVEPLNGPVFNPADPTQFIWISRRDGFDHLNLYRTDGTFLRQLTRGEWCVTDFLGWDSRGRFIFFRATDPSPLERHIYRLDMNSGTRLRLTPDPGTHEAWVSPDGKYLIDSWSSYMVPRRVQVRESGAGALRTILDAPNPAAGLKMGTYKPFTIKAADKKTDLYGYLVLPPAMDSTKKHPIILYVYGGPHAQLVLNTWMGGASGWQHYMACQGYICMTLDNRGSDGRGRDFEQVIHRHLGQAEMADQMEGIHYLSTLPYADAGRIGVHGWSYGGFMTTSLMLNYPDVFKTGVAGGPVTDWRYYEVMYGERYMDMPSENQEGYDLTSTLPKVKNLRGRLMLIHGDVDPTVVWQNSTMFLRMCIDEGKLVDYMVYPRHPHNVRGKDRVHLMRTVTRYFQENL
jgi:dipeptidyl-peptidase-4